MCRQPIALRYTVRRAGLSPAAPPTACRSRDSARPFRTTFLRVCPWRPLRWFARCAAHRSRSVGAILKVCICGSPGMKLLCRRSTARGAATCRFHCKGNGFIHPKNQRAGPTQVRSARIDPLRIRLERDLTGRGGRLTLLHLHPPLVTPAAASRFAVLVCIMWRTTPPPYGITLWNFSVLGSKPMCLSDPDSLYQMTSFETVIP